LISLGILFTAIAVLFLAVVIRDYLRIEQKMTPARSTYLRIAIIFAAVGILLQIAHRLLP
jgi:hypothetical protein